ncbi:MAG: prolyl oligopeptidase family serine peptidase [Opitutaceae bacterium]|nr:prolyl oligopeptidase family serine peptidase [Opitutaceae bacterium]
MPKPHIRSLLRMIFLSPRIVAAFALLLALTGVPAKALVPAAFLYGTQAKTGAEPFDLPYRFLLPGDYNPANAYPVVLFLHGSYEVGNDNETQLTTNGIGFFNLIQDGWDTHRCILVVPQANATDGWNGNTIGQVVRAIRDLSTRYSIDLNRIYVTGPSMGGYGTWSAIRLYPFFFAAAVPVSGGGSSSYERMAGTPIWCFHAVDDGAVTVSGSDNGVSGTRQAGGQVIYTRYATGDHMIALTAYSNPYLLPWMMAQRRNQPLAGPIQVSITDPAGPLVPPSIVSARNVSGTAAMPGGVTKVNWTFTPAVGNAGIDTNTYAFANGTSSWSVSGATVAADSTLFLAVATGSSWGNGSPGAGGVTTVNDTFWNVPLGANLTAPTLTIKTPSTTGSASVATALVSLTGTATAATGKTVKGITWSNSRGGRGIGVGTTTWNIDAIDLVLGANVITVTVRDSAGIAAVSSITVIRSGNPGAGGTYGNGGQPWAIPAAGLRLQSENYDEGGEGVAFHDTDARQGSSTLRATGTANDADIVVIANGADAPGAKLAYLAAGEWLRYTLTVPATGRYDLRLRVSNASAAAIANAITVRWKGAMVSAPVTVPSTGGADTFATVVVNGVTLTAGTDQLQLSLGAAGFGVNWLELVPVGAAPYAAWISNFFVGGSAALSDPSADPDSDGVANLHEYGLGRDPNAAEAPLAPTVWTDNGTGSQYLALTFKRAKGASVVAEISDDLVTWSSAPANLVQQGSTTSDVTGLYETVAFRSTATTTAKPRQFLRVRVTSP